MVTLDLKNKINMENITVSMPYIGKVGVDYSPSQVSITKKKEKQAQIMATKPTSRSIDNIALKFQKTITACGGGLTGCSHLPRGKIAFANEIERSIRVVKSDGSLDFKIDFEPYIPFDVTYITDNNTIAVTSKNSHTVELINLHTKQMLKELRVGSPCLGIAYTKGILVVRTRGKGLIEVNPHDGSIKTIVSDNIDAEAYVATTEDKIYSTNYSRKSVKCYDC
ncbi:unnamed protein product [Mytilus coruscus]|uniref:Uncharacterized protein n=1 Tax=Mytilus coruscus TaxID=42192 RepID=A0A6J8EV37_MYTCO|nr:unnamed protein product [Mytilus coruscus]